jgi:hypothetical protein
LTSGLLIRLRHPYAWRKDDVHAEASHTCRGEVTFMGNLKGNALCLKLGTRRTGDDFGYLDAEPMVLARDYQIGILALIVNVAPLPLHHERACQVKQLALPLLPRAATSNSSTCGQSNSSGQG